MALDAQDLDALGNGAGAAIDRSIGRRGVANSDAIDGSERPPRIGAAQPMVGAWTIGLGTSALEFVHRPTDGTADTEMLAGLPGSRIGAFFRLPEGNRLRWHWGKKAFAYSCGAAAALRLPHPIPVSPRP